MNVICTECGIIFACIDKKTNKAITCKDCPDAEYCSARFDFTGNVVSGICGECAKKLYGDDFQ